MCFSAYRKCLRMLDLNQGNNSIRSLQIRTIVRVLKKCHTSWNARTVWCKFSGMFPLVKLLVCFLSIGNWKQYDWESVETSPRSDATSGCMGTPVQFDGFGSLRSTGKVQKQLWLWEVCMYACYCKGKKNSNRVKKQTTGRDDWK